MKKEAFSLIVLLVLLSLPCIAKAIPVELSDQGTDAREASTGNKIFLGNLTVEIWDGANAGNKVWNDTFASSIKNGSWNIMLGEKTELNLEYGQEYWKDYYVNQQDINFTNSTGSTIARLKFNAPIGVITGEDTNFSRVNVSGLVAQPGDANNLTIYNATGSTIAKFKGDGQLEIWNPAGGAGNYLSLYHDGTNGLIQSNAGNIGFRASNSNIIWDGNYLYPATANAVSLGYTANEWRTIWLGEDASSGAYFGLDQDWRLHYDEAVNDKLILNGTNVFEIINSTSGQTIFRVNANNTRVGIGTANPTHTLHVAGDLNVSGAAYLGNTIINAQNITTAGILAKAGDQNNLTIYNSTGSTIAKFRGDGQLQVWNPAGGANDYLAIYHDGTHSYFDAASGGNSLGNTGGRLWWVSNTLYPVVAGDLGATTNEWRSLYLGNGTSSGVYFGMGQESTLLMTNAQATAPTMVWGLPNGANGNSLILTSNTYLTDDYDHPAQSNPTLFVQTNVDPDTDNTRWGSISHDNTSFVIDSGSDAISLEDNTLVEGNLSIGDNIGITLATMQDNGTKFEIRTVNPIETTKGVIINGDLNVTGTSYLGSVTLTADNITVSKIIPELGDNNNLTIYNATGSTIAKFKGDGKLEIWNPAGGANDYVHISHDATNGNVWAQSGNLWLGSGGNTPFGIGTTGVFPNGVSSVDVGATTAEFRSLYLGEDASSGAYFGLDQDWQLFYDEANNDRLKLNGTNAFEIVNKTSGQTIFFVNATDRRVGIGTTTPSQTLVVVGDFNVTGTSYLGSVTINTQNITTAGILAKAGDQNNLTIYNATGSTIAKFKGDGQLEIWNPAGGAGDYMSIWHDGSSGHIGEAGTAAIDIDTNSIYLRRNPLPPSANSLSFGSAIYEWRALYLSNGTSSGIYFGLGQESTLLMSNAQATAPALIWGLPASSSSYGNSLIFVDNARITDDYDHPAQTNPTLFIHSQEDPDSSNTKWGLVTHDNTTMLLDSGDNMITLNDNTTVKGDLVIGENGLGNLLVDMYDNSTEFVIEAIHNVSFRTAKMVSADNVFRLVPIAGGSHPVTCDASSRGGLFVNNTGKDLCICGDNGWMFVSNRSGC